MKNVQNMHILELENVKYNDEVYLGKNDAKVTADKIIENFTIFESIVNIQTASNLNDSPISFYIFYTKRAATIDGVEWAAFLSNRSGYSIDSKGESQYRPGNPVLRHTQTSDLYRKTCPSDKTIITRKQMIDDLGFKVEVLFHSRSMLVIWKMHCKQSFNLYLLVIVDLFGENQIRKQNMKFLMGMFTLLGLLIPQRLSH